MPKQPKSSGLKERLFGLLFLVGGIAGEYRFIQAFLHGGSFGLIGTAFAPAAVAGGLVLLVKPQLFGSVTSIRYDGKDMGDTLTWTVIGAVAVIGFAINAWLYFHPNR